MKQSEYREVVLLIQGAPMTEIHLVDGRMRKIRSGVGELKVTVRPGIYKIRSRKGGTHRDRLIEVRGDQHHQVEKAPVIETETSAPLFKTRTSHEYQAYPAKDLSHKIHRTIGQGCRLFVFVRDPQSGPEGSLPWDLPLDSIAVYSLEGDYVADLSVGEVNQADGYAGLNLEMDPGTWRLRVETGSWGNYEIFLTTVEGWQTQAFFSLDDFRKEETTLRRPSLREALVMMAKISCGFDPEGKEEHLVAMARTALGFGRSLRNSREMTMLMEGKFRDPLLGVYGLHLARLGLGRSHYDLNHVLHNVIRMLGSDHPDVLALRLEIDPESVDREAAFRSPPLLYHSWQSILRASRSNNRFIPGESLLSRLAEDFLAAKPWLIHRVGDSSARVSKSTSLADARRMLTRLLELPAMSDPAVRMADIVQTDELSGLERGILQSARARQTSKARGYTSIDPAASARHLFESIDAPGYSIANATARLIQRLESLNEKSAPSRLQI